MSKTPQNSAPTAQDISLKITEQKNPAEGFSFLEGALALDGLVLDADSKEFAFAVDKTRGDYGSLTLNANTGAYKYTLDERSISLKEGQKALENFIYTVKDDHGAAISKGLSIEITGTNDAPSAQNIRLKLAPQPNCPECAVLEGALALDGQVIDPDSNKFTFSIDKTQGSYGSILLDENTGAYTYALNENAQKLAKGQKALETFTYTVRDGSGGKTSKILSIEITGMNASLPRRLA